MNFALSRSVVGMLLCACGVTVASAQLAEKPTSTRDFLQKMDAYYAQLLPDHAPATISGTGFKPYMRYKWLVEPRLGDLDDLPPLARWHAWERLKEIEADQNRGGLPTWFSLGATNAAGRCLAIEVRPGDSNTVYAGFASGGLWRSTDAGLSWTPLTDFLPTLAIGCIEFDESDPDRMWMGTGEGWGNLDAVHGVGVLFSSDAGVTWQQTGMSAIPAQGLDIYELEYNEATGVLMVARDGGLYRSTDDGATFDEVMTEGTWKDIEIKPGSTDTYYANVHGSSANGFYKSTDDGLTWTQTTTGLPASNLIFNSRIATTPDDPNVIYYAIANSGGGMLGIYRSTDGGESFSLRSTQNHYGNQGWYDLTIAVDPEDSGRVWSGGVQLWFSSNGGASFSQIAGNVHVDHHATEWDPNNPDIFWVGSDGGVYRSTNSGSTFSSRNDGLVTLQFYAMNHSWIDLNRAYGGTQDNGTWRYTGTSAFGNILGGDGFECETGYADVNLVFAEIQFGEHYRSTTGGSGMTRIGTGLEQGPWQTPTHLDYADDNIIYTAHNTQIYRSTNRGTNWTSVYSPPAFGGGRAIAQCYRHPDFIAVAGASRVFYSTDRGISWQPTAATPATASAISDIVVHPDDPDIMAITLATYSTTFRQAYKTTNRGASWFPIDDTLPGEACQSLAIDFDRPDIWFLGSDLTLYVSFDQGLTWSPLNNGLPNVICDDVRWHPAGYLRVGTHGRGMWELDISGLSPSSVETEGPARIEPLTLRIVGNPASDRTVLRYGLRAAGNARIGLYDASGRRVRSILDEYLPATSDGFEIEVRDLPSGIYFARLDANGASVSRKLIVEH